MSDVSFASAVGSGVRKQTGKALSPGKRKKKKGDSKEKGSSKTTSSGRSSEDKVTGSNPYVEGELVDRPVRGSIGTHGEIYEGQEINKPRPVSGGSRKALPKPGPKAIEEPPAGPFVAQKITNLETGNPTYNITKLPRQFKGKTAYLNQDLYTGQYRKSSLDL